MKKNIVEEKGIRVRETGEIKLKGRAGRDILPIDFKKTFGFLPERIVVRARPGKVCYFKIGAILTEAEIKKEDREIKQREKSIKEIDKKLAEAVKNKK